MGKLIKSDTVKECLKRASWGKDPQIDELVDAMPEAGNAPANPTERPAQRPAKPEEPAGRPAWIDMDKILALAESGKVRVSISVEPDGTRIDIVPWEV